MVCLDDHLAQTFNFDLVKILTKVNEHCDEADLNTLQAYIIISNRKNIPNICFVRPGYHLSSQTRKNTSLPRSDDMQTKCIRNPNFLSIFWCLRLHTFEST